MRDYLKALGSQKLLPNSSLPYTPLSEDSGHVLSRQWRSRQMATLDRRRTRGQQTGCICRRHVTFPSRVLHCTHPERTWWDLCQKVRQPMILSCLGSRRIRRIYFIFSLSGKFFFSHNDTLQKKRISMVHSCFLGLVQPIPCLIENHEFEPSFVFDCDG